GLEQPALAEDFRRQRAPQFLEGFLQALPGKKLEFARRQAHQQEDGTPTARSLARAQGDPGILRRFVLVLQSSDIAKINVLPSLQRESAEVSKRLRFLQS